MFWGVQPPPTFKTDKDSPEKKIFFNIHIKYEEISSTSLLIVLIFDSTCENITFNGDLWCHTTVLMTVGGNPVRVYIVSKIC